MTEEQLNENLIKSELQCICQDCIYLDKIVPIIREMLLEEYKTGLEQSRFDKNMLEIENQKLKKQLEEKETKQKEFIELLENEIKERTIDVVNYHPSSQLIIEKIIEVEKMILEKYKEITGKDINVSNKN